MCWAANAAIRKLQIAFLILPEKSVTISQSTYASYFPFHGYFPSDLNLSDRIALAEWYQENGNKAVPANPTHIPSYPFLIPDEL